MRILLSILLLASVSYAAETDVEFVFDVSGSMAKQLDGQAQIDIARKALVNAMRQIPSDQMVAMRVFAHRVEQTNQAESCKDTELLIPFAKPDVGAAAIALASLSPKGYTPIAYSLERAAEDMIEAGKMREPKRVIILLSDGEETCGGDSVAVLKRLREQGFEVIVHTIGFNVDEVARKQLEEIAAFSGGKYFDAKDGAKLGAALEEATKETYVIEKTKEEFKPGSEIRGGDGFTSAVEFKKEWQGVVFRLDHHLKRGDLDYFYIELTSPTHISFEIQNLGKKIQMKSDGTFTESEGGAYAQIALHRSDYSRLDYFHTYSRPLEKAARKLSLKPGKYYFLLGGPENDLHKDGASFLIKPEVLGDLGGEQDAGDSILTALPIEVGKKYELNHLSGGSDKFDDVDTFKIEAKAGDKFSVLYNSLLTSGWDSVRFRVVDAFNTQVASSQRGEGTGGAPMLGTFSVTEDGTYYVQLTLGYGDIVHPYSLEVKKEGAPAAAPAAQVTPAIEDEAPQAFVP